MHEKPEQVEVGATQKPSRFAKVRQKINHYSLVVGVAMTPAITFAAEAGAGDAIDISDAKTQLGLATAAAVGLGGKKLVPAATSWVFAMLTRMASR